MMAGTTNGQTPSLAGTMNGNGSAALTNGKDKAAIRQSTSSALVHNGASDRSSNTYFGHNREEVTRILIQALSDLGYSDAAESVIHSSGYALESQAVSDFRQAVLQGDWAAAETLLLTATTAGPETAPIHKGSVGNGVSGLVTPAQLTGAAGTAEAASATSADSAANGNAIVARREQGTTGLVLVPDANRTLMRFSLRQQKYLECLEQGDTAKALAVLRNELTPLYRDTQKLHFLSGLLMCQSEDDLKDRAGWDGAAGQSRQNLLSQLARFISPAVMLPEHRLAKLLGQVKEYQVSGCIYHTRAQPPSLYTDHFCDRSLFPSQVLRELESHEGEVWQVRFSHDGRRLASCGSGRYVIIWDMADLDTPMKLDGHQDGTGDVAWSPDDKKLVSCGRDGRARLWDTGTGLLDRRFEDFDEPISSCVWTADGQSIVIGSFDKHRALCQWSLLGQRLYTWSCKHRTEALALSPNGQWLVAMDDAKHLYVYSFTTRELVHDITMEHRGVSLAISQDSNFLLVNRQDGESRLYSLGAQGVHLVRKYVGATGGNCIIRSDFGGADESFVISGSEDGNINIWHKTMGIHLFKIDAHKPRCNAVAWSPTDPCLFASCGDDKTIKLERIAQASRAELDVSVGNGLGSLVGRGPGGWRTSLSNA